MSKQLALSAAFSVLAMSVYVLLGSDMPGTVLAHGSAMLPQQVHAPALPAIGTLIPGLR